MKEIGILGGGVAGLSLGYFIGKDCEILEKSASVGGLCKSYEKDGFTFDLGGHIIFSRDTEILDFELELLEGKTNKLFRKANCYYKNRFVKYPFENGLSVLDKEDIYEILVGFVNNPPRPQNNFEDWIYNTFGKGLAEKYLIPYNQKIWKTPLTEMGVQWVERVPKPPVEDLVKSALGIETEGYVHQLYFHYPKTGGFETLPKTLAEHLPGQIATEFPVKKVLKDKQKWRVISDKDEREYEKLICAMPIYDLAASLENVPTEVVNAVSALQYNSLIVVMVGLNRPRREDMVTCFFPEKEIIFHRLVFFDYFGSNYAPEGCSSMVVEITGKENDQTFSMTDEQVAQRVIDDLTREGLIQKNEVVTTAVKRVKYAYPIYDLHREKNLEIVNAFCAEQKIELCGRFAEFNYLNSDAVIRSAKTVAARVREGVAKNA